MATFKADIDIWWRLNGPNFETDDIADEGEEAGIRRLVLGECDKVAMIFDKLIPHASVLAEFRDVDLTSSGVDEMVLGSDIDKTLASALNAVAVTKQDYDPVADDVRGHFDGMALPNTDPGAAADAHVVEFGLERLNQGAREPYYIINDAGDIECIYDRRLTVNGEAAILRPLAPAASGGGWIEVFSRVAFKPTEPT